MLASIRRSATAPAGTVSGFIARVVLIGCWAAVAAMAFFIVARLAVPDRFLVLIWANAYTFWIYLPAYAAAAVAALLVRWRLLAAAGVVVAFHLVWVLPDFRPGESIPADAYSAPKLRLMTANVYFGNPDLRPLAREILEVDPDVLFIQEYGPKMEDALESEGVTGRYSYAAFAAENPYFGTAVFSRLPLSNVETVHAGRRPYIRATVNIGGHDVRLYDIHATSPGFGPGIANDWNDGWQSTFESLRSEPGLVIAAGDFNMTQNHRWYRELERAGFTSSHEERGRGRATTWPQGRKLPMIRIDQVFHNAGVVTLSIREGRGEGSDHRPIIAELAIVGR